MRFLETDGGKQFSHHPKEDRDCTVLAMAVACGVSYDEAHDMLREAGRRRNCAFAFPSRRNLSAQIGDWWLEYYAPARGETLGRFADRNRTGSWIVGVNLPGEGGHIVAVRNGIVRDHPRWPEDTPLVEIWSLSRVPRFFD